MEPWVFDLCGGHLALDFANTISNRGTPEAVDRIPDYGELLRFAEQTGGLTAARAKRLRGRAKADPRAAEAALQEAHHLRDALYDIFRAVSDGEPVPEGPLATFNAAASHLHVGPSLEWEWTGPHGELDEVLGPVVEQGLSLLLSHQHVDVHVCEAPTCEWLFLDTSKNKRRKWCDMKVCGNRQKARRFYQKSHEA